LYNKPIKFTMENNKSSSLFLHRHPVMEIKCKVDIGHVIVDRNHWEAVLTYLHAHPDLRTEIHNASFGSVEPCEDLSLEGKEEKPAV